VTLERFNPVKLYARRSEILPRLADIGRRMSYRLGVIVDQNGLSLQALRNAHAGKRAFIIGNGPSLRIADLNLIRNEISFGSNKVYLAFDQTEWRPTYYSVCDKLVAKNNHEVIKGLKIRKVFSDQIQEYFLGESDITWVHESSRNASVQGYLDRGGEPVSGYFSTELLAGVDGGWTVIYQQLQMAYYMGITDVVILGMDFSFSVPEKRVQSNIRGYDVQLESSGEVNHFHPDYRKPGEIWGIPRLDCQQYLMEVARRQFAAVGRSIVNASRTSKLEVFEKQSLEQVLEYNSRHLSK